MFIIVKDCESDRDKCISSSHIIQMTSHWIFEETTIFVLTEDVDVSVDIPLETVLKKIQRGLENGNGMIDLRKKKKDD